MPFAHSWSCGRTRTSPRQRPRNSPRRTRLEKHMKRIWMMALLATTPGPGADQCGYQCPCCGQALHRDQGHHTQPAVAYRLPARRAHADHREGRQGFPHYPARRKDRSDWRASGAVRWTEWPVRHLPFPDLRAGTAGIYLTYTATAPGEDPATSGLTLAHATLDLGATPTLSALKVIWRDPINGKGGQAAGAVAFSPRWQADLSHRRRPAALHHRAGPEPAPPARSCA